MDPQRDIHPKARTPWLDCFPKLTNRELRTLYSAGFHNATQPEIVLYILTQTRGVGRVMAGELDGAGHEEWEEALDTYGRESAPLFRGGIAHAIGRADRYVARQLRRLIAAGVVIEHQAGHKNKPAVLSVDLDASHWHRAALACDPSPQNAGTDRYPDTQHSGTDRYPDTQHSGTDRYPCLRERDVNPKRRPPGKRRAGMRDPQDLDPKTTKTASKDAPPAPRPAATDDHDRRS